MAAHRLEKDPLQFQVQTKVNELDYINLLQRSKYESVSQAFLVRDAVRQYLSPQKLIIPPTTF